MEMDPQAGFSESEAMGYRSRRGSSTALAGGTPPQRFAGFSFLEDTLDEEPQHFLDACSLCMKALHPNRDIYMYRGDTPFCSVECRQEQIEMDEAMQKSRKLSSSFKAAKKSSVAIRVKTGTGFAG